MSDEPQGETEMRSYDRVHETVKETIDFLINGRVPKPDVERLDHAVGQAKRGVTGPFKGKL